MVGSVCAAAVLWAAAATAIAEDFSWGFLPPPIVPADNPLTPDKVELGRRLFSETGLSSTGSYSCASCHQPQLHFTDGLPTAVGATGERHSRNTPTLYNAAYNASLGWEDLGVTTLEAQHRIPLFNASPVEMGYDESLLAGLAGRADYPAAFEKAFEDGAISTDNVVKALASYVRTLVAPQSAFDRYLFHDDAAAFSADARAGMDLFFSPRLGCSECHASLSLSGPITHTVQSAEPVFHVTAVGGSDTAFRAPTLRRVAYTAPYMHDGSLATLTDVLRHYQTVRVERVPDFTLSAAEEAQLIAFLEAL